MKIASEFLRDAGLVLLRLGRGLALGELGHRLLEHLGMSDEVVLDDRLDVGALGIGEAVGRRGRGRAEQGEREQRGSKQAQRRHRQILLSKAGFGKRPG
ncbi:hypothetical protein ACVWWP_005151 [Bradyrhizobium sp. LM3.6]